MPLTPRDNEDIPGRVPVSYRASAGSMISSDDASTRPAGFNTAAFRSLEQNGLDGIFYGCSRIKMRDITDGTSNTILIGESRTSVYSKDGQQMDYWQFGSPQTGNWNLNGTGGTEYSEGLGSCVVKPNANLDLTLSGVLMEMAFGSYHIGGAQYTWADGSSGSSLRISISISAEPSGHVMVARWSASIDRSHFPIIYPVAATSGV